MKIYNRRYREMGRLMDGQCFGLGLEEEHWPESGAVVAVVPRRGPAPLPFKS